MLRLGLVLAILSFPSQASADWLYRSSQVFTLFGHGADLAETMHCVGAQKCKELNPFLLQFEQPLVFGGVKAGVAGGGILAMDKLKQNHRNWAIVANFAVGGAMLGLAIRTSNQVKR